MNTRKMNLNRPNLNSEEIQARQNFDQVLSKHLSSKPPLWKSPWFWGPTGLASVGIALFLSVSYLNSQNNINEETNTLTVKDLPKDTECIHPPLKNEDIAFQKFEVDARKDEKIVLSSGTSVEIPKGSLLPEDPSQKVQIEIREFPDKTSAFVAGIPMDYQQESAFISAGMLEIRGKQNEEVVAINTGNPIEIDMKLTKNAAGFDFWYLDESAKSWGKYPAEIANEPVSASGYKIQKKSPEEIKEKIAELDVKIAACDERKENIQKPSVVEYKIPEANHQMFDLDFNKKIYPELAKFENLVFEIIPTSGYDKTFTKKTWSEVKLEKAKENYEMIFISSSERMKVPVRPVLQGKELAEAEKQFDLAMKEFASTLKEIEVQKANLEVEKAANRRLLETELDRLAESSSRYNPAVKSNQSQVASFEVQKWGVYNCDKPSQYPRAAENIAFVWENQPSPAEFETMYVFNLEKDIRYTYSSFSARNIDNFGIDKKGDLVILGIDREGKLAFSELKNRKDKTEPQKIVFSKMEEGESAVNLLKKLLDETLAAV